MAQTTPDFGERYRVERELGRGGMATVYLCTDTKFGRQVAIKLLHPELGAAVGALVGAGVAALPQAATSTARAVMTVSRERLSTVLFLLHVDRASAILGTTEPLVRTVRRRNSRVNFREARPGPPAPPSVSRVRGPGVRGPGSGAGRSGSHRRL